VVARDGAVEESGMRIVIVGAGGVGGYFGARLLAAGQAVTFVARGRHGQALREQGLRVTSPLGDLQVSQVDVVQPGAQTAPADLIVFTVKLPDAEAAAALLPPLMHPGTVVLPFQNGVDVAEVLTRHVGADAVALGVAYIAAHVAAPGVVAHGGSFARLRFGALQAAQEPVLRDFLAACQRAGIDAGLSDDIRRTVWEKFVFLVGLSGLTALTRLPIGVTRADPELRRLLRDVIGETWALARVEGIALADDFVDRQMGVVDALPAGMKASMLHDLEAGRPLELPWLAAAVVRRSEALGLAAPANRFVAAALGPYAHGRPAAA
jgi:2-dehydropantoate 2-reductase